MNASVFQHFFGARSNDTYFYKWNRVIVRYCDGASFAGDADKPDPVTNLYYRGARIFRAAVRDLMARGMEDSSNVLLAGGSSGVMIHCDGFRRMFSAGVRVKCLADSSLFLHVKDPVRAKFFDTVFGTMVGMQHPGGALPTRRQTIAALPPASARNGYILTSIFQRSLASGIGYKGPMFADPKSKSFESAFLDWYFDRARVHLVDPADKPFVP
ncbi:unnamed protein product [Cuscuta campestris]|uniref:Pectin acetylesterase n=1 Tax=Cuscuta campestris TaxID=132261 RepID=A0A484KKL3_9ASTE|nr:unnamed protein product [Cuscuta campestris]